MVICFTKYLLSSKKEISKIWLAAHWEKKLRRTQIFEVDIERSVHDILEAEIILDLRISGHLLVGIVRIHSRKTKYLLNECNSIFYQVKGFRTGLIDLPENKQTAAINDITLADFLDNFNDGNNLIDSMLTANQIPLEEITLKEIPEKLTLLDDDDFREFVFHEEDEPITLDALSLNFDEEELLMKTLEIPVNINGTQETEKTCNNKQTKEGKSYKNGEFLFHEEDEPITLDGLPLNFDDEELLMKTLDIPVNINGTEETEKICNNKQTKEGKSYKKVNKSACNSEDFNSENFVDEIPESIEIPDFLNEDEVNSLPINLDPLSTDFKLKSSDKLLLEPLRNNKFQVSPFSKNKKIKKRKLHVDYIKTMSYEAIKKQVTDTSDIISVLDLTPATKRLMILKEIGCAEKLFKLPAQTFLNPSLLKLYQRNLKTCKCDDDLELFHSEEEPSENVNSPGKNFDSISVPNMEENGKSSIESEFLDYDDNLMFDTVLENVTRNQDEERDQRVPEENVLNISEIESDSNNIQSTQISKTSEERWEYALQGKIIQMLQDLKLLFEEKSVICFSSLTQNKNKSQVAQKFLCLLMLQKFEVISLKQKEAFGEICILPQMNFDIACAKFVNI